MLHVLHAVALAEDRLPRFHSPRLHFRLSTPARPQTPAPISTSCVLSTSGGGFARFRRFSGLRFVHHYGPFCTPGPERALTTKCSLFTSCRGRFPPVLATKPRPQTNCRQSPFSVHPNDIKRGASKPRAYRGPHMSTSSSSYAGRPGCPHSFGTASPAQPLPELARQGDRGQPRLRLQAGQRRASALGTHPRTDAEGPRRERLSPDIQIGGNR